MLQQGAGAPLFPAVLSQRKALQKAVAFLHISFYHGTLLGPGWGGVTKPNTKPVVRTVGPSPEETAHCRFTLMLVIQQEPETKPRFNFHAPPHRENQPLQLRAKWGLCWPSSESTGPQSGHQLAGTQPSSSASMSLELPPILPRDALQNPPQSKLLQMETHKSRASLPGRRSW